MSKDPEPEISQDVSMTDASTSPTTKRKRSETSQPPVTQCTIRNPPWSYLHLSLITSAPNYQLDALTAHLHLRAALSQFLGLHGTAIPVDILKLKGSDVHVRVPREDASAVVIAVGGWMGKGGEGWRVKSQGSWGVGLSSSAEVDLFKNISKVENIPWTTSGHSKHLRRTRLEEGLARRKGMRRYGKKRSTSSRTRKKQ
ncbi:hypothetical protein E4T47_08136 [Aureobasidium subglaciale]|nr:hypothetical protein E4T47_08136 [Aureobasidium subglaciale]